MNRSGRAKEKEGFGSVRGQHGWPCRWVSHTLAGVLLLGLGLAVGGCKRKDEEKCQQALQTTRQALAVEDFALARQWRTYTYKQCADADALKAIDQEIVTREAEVAKKKAEDEARQAEEDRKIAAAREPEVKEPEAVRTESATTSFRKIWTFEIIELSLVPQPYLKVDESAIRRAIARGERNNPGVNIYQKTLAAVR